MGAFTPILEDLFGACGGYQVPYIHMCLTFNHLRKKTRPKTETNRTEERTRHLKW